MEEQEISQDYLKTEAEEAGISITNQQEPSRSMASRRRVRNPKKKRRRVPSIKLQRLPVVHRSSIISNSVLEYGGYGVFWYQFGEGQPSFSTTLLTPVYQGCAICLVCLEVAILPNLGEGIYYEGLQAGVSIVDAYLILLMINADYIILSVVPIIMLAFIGALCRQISVSGSLRCDSDNNHATQAADNKTEDYGASSTGGNNVGADDKYVVQAVIIVLRVVRFIWNIVGQVQFHGGQLFVVSQFLAFISFTLKVLSSMLARLRPSSEVAPALDVLRKAYLVVVLLTAHAAAVELLGEDVVLACTPELVVVVVWFVSHLDYSSYPRKKKLSAVGSWATCLASLVTDKATLRREASVACLGALVALLAHASLYVNDYSDEELLMRYQTAVCVLFVSGILPFFCEFVLRQWTRQTKAKLKASSELEGAFVLFILFKFCRSLMLMATALLLVAPILDARLGLQVEGQFEKLMGYVLKV